MNTVTCRKWLPQYHALGNQVSVNHLHCNSCFQLYAIWPSLEASRSFVEHFSITVEVVEVFNLKVICFLERRSGLRRD